MQSPPDFLEFVLAIIAFFASKEIAATVGPFAAIFVLACAGAALSLSGTPTQMSYGRALLYIGIRILVAVVLTVSMAELLQKIVPWASPRYTLTPIAFAIGWIKDYNSVRTWFGSVIDRWAAKRIDDNAN